MTTIAQRTLPMFLDWLEEGRARGQVRFDDKQGTWQVYGHPEASEILSDSGVFSSDLSAVMPPQEDYESFQKGNFVRMDPPRHRKLRGLVSQAFTPRMVAGLEPRIAEVTHDLLDEVEGRARLDLIDALAYPLPVIVIAELLGIPTGDRPVFRRWADVLFDQNSIDPEESLETAGKRAMAKAAPTIREMNAYLLDHIRARAAHPGDDLTSTLLQVEVDGERLDEQEIVGFVGLLLLAGHITTTATLGNTIVSLDECPEAAEEIRRDPGLLPGAIEESIRYRTPFPRLVRMTTAPTRVGGVDLPAGAVIQLWVTAANRDPRIFDEPNRFDIRRRPNPHLSFGHGIHFCLGAPLARLEAKVALRILLERYGDITVAADEPVVHRNPWLMVSVNRLPLDVSIT
ncbi:cytochrome P450 [Actinoplanes sp. NPDC051851]|uniref:cytochrome P450 n=1 Tax=Actinoplanes sp. NPDC051851 TaxID=3154753 RepID=UPI00341E9A2F